MSDRRGQAATREFGAWGRTVAAGEYRLDGLGPLGIALEVVRARRVITIFQAQFDLACHQQADQPVDVARFDAVKVGLDPPRVASPPVSLETLAHRGDAAKHADLGRFIAFRLNIGHGRNSLDEARTVAAGFASKREPSPSHSTVGPRRHA